MALSREIVDRVKRMLAEGAHRNQSPREDFLEQPSGSPVQCPTCHRRVLLPCIACRTVEAVRAGSRRINGHDSRESVANLSMCLKEEHQQRYQELRDKMGLNIERDDLSVDEEDTAYERQVLSVRDDFAKSCEEVEDGPD